MRLKTLLGEPQSYVFSPGMRWFGLILKRFGFFGTERRAHEGLEVFSELGMAVVTVASGHRFLENAAHPVGPVVAPEMVRFCQTMLDGAHGPLFQLHEGDLAGPVNPPEHMQRAFLGPDLGNVDMEMADGIALELLLRLTPVLHVRQTADAMTLEQTVQGVAAEMRDRIQSNE